ncbi:MAG: hypothetical protein ABIJ19_00790 [Patescibacteria group bacterium]
MDFQQFNQQPISPQPEPNIQPTPPIITQSPKNNWKVVILVIIGVLVLGGASYGAYYYWQNNKPAVAPIDEIANWQTYQNEIAGFEIKYPNNWEVTWDKILEKGGKVVITNKTRSIEQFVIQLDKDSNHGSNPENLSIKEINLDNGYPAIINSSKTIIFLSKNSDVYRLENGMGTEIGAINEDLFLKIANTFKFTK